MHRRWGIRTEHVGCFAGLFPIFFLGLVYFKSDDFQLHDFCLQTTWLHSSWVIRALLSIQAPFSLLGLAWYSAGLVHIVTPLWVASLLPLCGLWKLTQVPTELSCCQPLPVNFKISLFTSTDNLAESLIKISLNVRINLGVLWFLPFSNFSHRSW